MNNLQIVEQLCAIVELQNKIILAQTEALAQIDAVVMEEDKARAEEMASALCCDNR